MSWMISAIPVDLSSPFFVARLRNPSLSVLTNVNEQEPGRTLIMLRLERHESSLAL